MNKHDDEQTLLNSLKRNEPAAFDILLQKYKNPVANICYRFLFNREDAEETAQEVFLAIYCGIGTFRGESKLSTWIYQLAVSKSIDLIRSRKQKKRFGKIVSLIGLQDQVKHIPDPHGKNPVETIENEEKGRIIQAAIAELPAKYSQAFTLSKCQGLSSKEIAEIMGLTQPAVETIVHRANKKLREILYTTFEKELRIKSKKMQTPAPKSVSSHRDKSKTFMIISISLIALGLIWTWGKELITR